PDPHDPIALAQGADGDRADRRIQTGHVAAAGENRDGPLAARHGPAVLPRVIARPAGPKRSREIASGPAAPRNDSKAPLVRPRHDVLDAALAELLVEPRDLLRQELGEL